MCVLLLENIYFQLRGVRTEFNPCLGQGRKERTSSGVAFT